MLYTGLGRTGFQVSKLGLGGAPLGGGFGPVTDQSAADVIHAALDAGINLIDTAPLYGGGESERRIGKALRGRRDSVIVATKAVSRGEAYSYDNVIRSVENSLRRLETDYIDLLQLHEPSSSNYDEIMNEAVPALIKLKEQGKIRACGVNERDLSYLLSFIRTNFFDTTQIFGRYTLIDNTAVEEFFPVTRNMGIGVINSGILHAGLLAEAPAEYMERYPEAIRRAKERMDQLQFLRKPESQGLVEPAIRFSLTCPDVDVTIIGTNSAEEIRRNATYCDGTGLGEKEQEKLLALFQGQRFA